MVNSIGNYLLKQEQKIDYIFFTGDLVQSAESIDNFKEASELFLSYLVEKLSFNKENIIFCCGNHDINRSQIHKAVLTYFESRLLSNNDLNKFYLAKDEVYLDSIKPLANYNAFLNRFYSDSENNIINDLYSVHFRVCNAKKIGIGTINTAWISTGDDMRKLYVPMTVLEELKRALKDCDEKIILLHHPLYFLKEYNFYELENFIHNEFNLMFSGHVHKVSTTTRNNGNNGIFDHVAKASLSNMGEALGFSLISVQDFGEIKVQEITYSKEANECYGHEPIVHTLPCGEEKIKQNSFRKKIFNKFPIELSNADDLLLSENENNAGDFLTLFNNIVLKTESDYGIDSSNSSDFNYQELIDDKKNYLIFGKDKCGKTSLLRKVQLENLKNFSRHGIIPFYIDCKEYESKINDKFNFEKLISSYFEINNSFTDQIIKSGNFKLLIDNFNPHSSISETINKFLIKYSSVCFVICSDYNITRTVEVYHFGNLNYKKLYFHDLSRKEILSYTEKWAMSNTENKEVVQEKIVLLCKQLELPLNYWTISLLLLIYKKSNDDYYKNLFEILDLCVSEILNKKYITLSRSRIGFDQLKRICSELAVNLLRHYRDNTYSASYLQILAIIDRSITSNNRISAEAKEVFDYLLNTGILKQKSDDSYTFRLNGFLEYFLAYNMTKNESFKNEIFENDSVYLAFKNEIEIYSGFRRNDLDFLNKVYEKTKSSIGSCLSSYLSESTDNNLMLKLTAPSEFADKIRKISVSKALSSQDKAEIQDQFDALSINSEVHLKPNIDTSELNSELLTQYLFVLSRVFRNSDEVTDDTVINEIFDYLLDSHCQFGFFIIDEFAKKAKDVQTAVDDNNELALLKIVTDFSPLLSEVTFYDGIGHFNIEGIVKNKIEQLKLDASNNQFKLFMLYFLFVDIDLKKNKDYIEEAMKYINIPILKTTIYLKLNFYLAFKTNGNKPLEKYLSNLILQAKLNMDNKSDISSESINIQERKRIALITKMKNGG